MPNLETHKGISKERTGEEYEELHKWIDEAKKHISFNHRIERHSYLTDYEKYIEGKWGKKAVVEWLFHIAIDNMETANKFATEVYFKNYTSIIMDFGKKELTGCKFIKEIKHRTRVQVYRKNNH